MSRRQPVKMHPTIACCGLDCELCPRYNTVGSSRCPGCCGPDFFKKHPPCSYITCCVQKKKVEVCAQCDEFPCLKFNSIVDGGSYDSFITYKKAYHNLNYLTQYGVMKFLEKQRTRINLLGIMLNKLNDGRSKSFYCIASTLLPVTDLETSFNEAKQQIKADHIDLDNVKVKTKILRGILSDFAAKQGLELNLRKKAQR